MQPFLAMITPVTNGSVPEPTPPWPPPHPSHPIWRPDLGIWGGPWLPPYPSHPMPPHPQHPIVVPPGGVWPTPPQPPLGIWGPSDPRPTNPIAGWNPGTGTFPPYYPPTPGHDLPLFPTHLPVVPPGGAWPQPPQPPGIWVGWPGYPNYPSHPIVLPPEYVPPTGPGAKPPVAPIPPDQVGAHPSTGVTNLYLWVPYVGVVGPIYVPPGVSAPSGEPPATPA